jgi:O-antigen ligase
MLSVTIGVISKNHRRSTQMRRVIHRAYLLSLLIACFQAAGIDPFGLVADVFGDVKLKRYDVTTGSRVYGSFYNANWAGCAACCWLSLIWLDRLAGAASRRDFVVRATLPVVFIAITGSRSAALSAGTLIFAWAVLGKADRSRLAVVVSLTIFVCGAMWWVASRDVLEVSAWFWPRWERLLDPSSDQSVVDRLSSWLDAWKAWQDAPWLGVGRLAQDQLPHNSLLSLLCAVGLTGTVASVLALIVALCRNVEESAPLRWWIGTLSSLGVMFCTGDFIWSTQVSLCAILVLAAGTTAMARPG